MADSTIIRVPKPPTSIFNPDRPVSSNLRAQLLQAQEAEFNLPVSQQTDVYINRIRTEREAGEYLKRVTNILTGQKGTREPGLPALPALQVGRPPSLRMLADLPITDERADRLGFTPFADALAGVIDSPSTTTPLVISINGEWGSGKTSLGVLVRNRLETKPAANGTSPHITCWFNAWMHDDASNLAGSLAAAVAATANRWRSRWRRILNPLPSALATGASRHIRKALRYSALLILAFGMCFLLARRLGYDASDVLKFDPKVVTALTTSQGGAYTLAFITAVVLLFKILSTIAPVAKSVADFVKDPRVAAETASINEARKQLGKLIARATPKGSKFVIFVDDLDRCRPSRLVNILEATNQLLDLPSVVVIVMADMRTIARSISNSHHSIERESNSEQPTPSVDLKYGWLYLQKIVQLQFDLPAYPIGTIRHMLERLTNEVPRIRVGFGSRMMSRLKRTALGRFVQRNRTARLRREMDVQIRNRMSAGESNLSEVESVVLNSNPGWKDDPHAAPLVRERIHRYLEDDSEIQLEAEDEIMRHIQPLPRHAKRILNRLRLSLFIAHACGIFGGEPRLGPREIGKWAVLCERWPELAQHLSSSPNTLSRLEGSSKLEYAETLSVLVPMYLDDPELKSLLQSRPLLSPVLGRLIQFQPAWPERAR